MRYEELIFSYCMSYTVTEDSVLEEVNASAEEKHINTELLSSANGKIEQIL